MKTATEGKAWDRYFIVEVNTNTSTPFLQVQYWPDDQHHQERMLIANVPYVYGNADSYREARKTAAMIAAAQQMLATLKIAMPDAVLMSELAAGGGIPSASDATRYRLRSNITSFTNAIAKAEDR